VRKCLALFWALALFASPFFFVYLEAEYCLGCPKDAYECLRLVLVLSASAAMITVPWFVVLVSEWCGHE